jgi:repressor of nif and glnA expression
MLFNLLGIGQPFLTLHPSPEQMTQDDEAADIIHNLLSDGKPRTTSEIENELAHRGAECSERVVRVLMMLKHRKRVVGSFSPEKRTWVWTVTE